MNLTSIEAFESAGKLSTKPVTIHGWNDATVTIRELSAQTLIDEMAKYDANTGMAKLIIASVVNPDTNEPVFQDTDEHVKKILKLNMKGVVELAKHINDFNGLGASASKNASADSAQTPLTATATA